MIFKEKQNRILSVTVKVLNNYDNYKLKDMDKEDKNMKYAAKHGKKQRAPVFVTLTNRHRLTVSMGHWL